MCGSVQQCAPVKRCVMQYVALCGSVLQRAAVCCRVFQCVAFLFHEKEGVGYGVALVSRIDKIIGLFCKRALQKRRFSAKETFNFIDPTDRSHPIVSTAVAMCCSVFAVCHGVLQRFAVDSEPCATLVVFVIPTLLQMRERVKYNIYS